jgi:hypothetical protein
VTVPALDTNPPAILSAVAAVMQAVTYVPKAGQYDGGRSGSYKFRRFEDTAAALGQAFRDHGIFVSSRVVSAAREIDKKPFKEGTGYQAWTSVYVTMEYRFTSLVDGSELIANSIGEGKDSSDKASAKAMTMAMKSALTQAFMIATDDPDPDADRPGDFAQPVGRGDPRAAARQRQSEENRAALPDAPASAKPDQRQEYLLWVQKQLADVKSADHVARLYSLTKERGLLGIDAGGVDLETRIRAALSNFGIDPNAAIPEPAPRGQA